MSDEAKVLYEYRTTEGPRKAWDGQPDLSKEGWEEYRLWERFDYTEQRYWRRPVMATSPPPWRHLDECLPGCNCSFAELQAQLAAKDAEIERLKTELPRAGAAHLAKRIEAERRLSVTLEALEQIAKEVGTSTLAHKLARQALKPRAEER